MQENPNPNPQMPLGEKQARILPVAIAAAALRVAGFDSAIGGTMTS